MSTIGRNDPCPCGSGRKHKHCCMRSASTTPRLQLGAAIRREARRERAWEADIVPIPAHFEDSPTARPAVVLVTAGGYVLGSEVLERPSPEPSEMAAELVRALEAAREAVGSLPEEVAVRFEALVEPLASRLGDGVGVVERPSLPGVDDAAEAFVREVCGVPDRRLRISSPDSWRGWDQPEEWIVEVFAAAAELYRVQPWEDLDDRDRLRLVTPDGASWAAVVLGSAGASYGLALYERVEDLEALYREDEGPDEQTGRTLSLLFAGREHVSRAMLRDVRKLGLEVAGPAAFPRLVTINTPAGGLTREDARSLLAATRATAGFCRKLGDEGFVEVEEGFLWRDEGTGATVVWEGVEDEAELESPWAQPWELAPGDAVGPGAEPGARLEEPDDVDSWVEGELEVVDRFRSWLEGRFTERTVEKHVSNAESFVTFLACHAGTPLRAVHEIDLRVFLFDFYPRKVIAPKDLTASVPVSLGRFFTFLAEEEGIECPWADAVLAERDAFAARTEDAPGHTFWEAGVAEWRALLYQDLDDRIMVPSPALAGGGSWGSMMGMVEAGLFSELEDRWLLWREEVIRSGVTEPAEVWERCARRQREWETTPHDRLDGATPCEAVLAARDESEGG